MNQQIEQHETIEVSFNLDQMYIMFNDDENLEQQSQRAGEMLNILQASFNENNGNMKLMENVENVSKIQQIYQKNSKQNEIVKKENLIMQNQMEEQYQEQQDSKQQGQMSVCQDFIKYEQIQLPQQYQQQKQGNNKQKQNSSQQLIQQPSQNYKISKWNSQVYPLQFTISQKYRILQPKQNQKQEIIYQSQSEQQQQIKQVKQARQVKQVSRLKFKLQQLKQNKRRVNQNIIVAKRYKRKQQRSKLRRQEISLSNQTPIYYSPEQLNTTFITISLLDIIPQMDLSYQLNPCVHLGIPIKSLSILLLSSSVVSPFVSLQHNHLDQNQQQEDKVFEAVKQIWKRMISEKVTKAKMRTVVGREVLKFYINTKVGKTNKNRQQVDLQEQEYFRINKRQRRKYTKAKVPIPPPRFNNSYLQMMFAIPEFKHFYKKFISTKLQYFLSQLNTRLLSMYQKQIYKCLQQAKSLSIDEMVEILKNKKTIYFLSDQKNL